MEVPADWACIGVRRDNKTLAVRCTTESINAPGQRAIQQGLGGRVFFVQPDDFALRGRYGIAEKFFGLRFKDYTTRIAACCIRPHVVARMLSDQLAHFLGVGVISIDSHRVAPTIEGDLQSLVVGVKSQRYESGPLIAFISGNFDPLRFFVFAVVDDLRQLIFYACDHDARHQLAVHKPIRRQIRWPALGQNRVLAGFDVQAIEVFRIRRGHVAAGNDLVFIARDGTKKAQRTVNELTLGAGGTNRIGNRSGTHAVPSDHE